MGIAATAFQFAACVTAVALDFALVNVLTFSSEGCLVGLGVLPSEGERVTFLDQFLGAWANWVSLLGQAPPVTHKLSTGRAGAVWRGADFTRKFAFLRLLLLRWREAFPSLAAGAVLVGLFEFNETGFAIDLLPAGFGDDLVLGLLGPVIAFAVIIVAVFITLRAAAD